jgi:hypothetical protein
VQNLERGLGPALERNLRRELAIVKDTDPILVTYTEKVLWKDLVLVRDTEKALWTDPEPALVLNSSSINLDFETRM